MTVRTAGEQCPDGWKPTCSCRGDALEPNENCWIHGQPFGLKCPFCGAFRNPTKPCTRCGCKWGMIKEVKSE